MWPNCLMSSLSKLHDRQDGVSLLAEALSHNHPTGRLHEYFRVIERAFAVSYRKACEKLLFRYFQPTDYQISQSELDSWIAIRDSSTHADIKPFITISETRKTVDRVELAAYDILFNKVHWRNQDVSRRKLFTPVYYSISNNDEYAIARGSTINIELQPFDGFYAYPLYLGKYFRIKLSSECIVAR